MVRFIHTADWQMGAKFSRLGGGASGARRTRLATARRIARLAQDRGVDFMLVAGDLFEHHALGSETIEGVIEALNETRVPVWILPGNHDPLTHGGIWSRRRWKERPEHIEVFTEETPVVLDGTVLYPCPLTQKRSRRDPTGWIPAQDEHAGGAVRVGVAHGSLDILGSDVNFPIAGDRAREAGLDYLALGDWHSVYEHDERTFYSGTPEPTAFDEREPGCILEVEIDRPGSVPRVTKHRVNSLDWIVREHDVSADPDLDELRSWISDLQSPGDTLLRLRLSGVVDLDSAARASRAVEDLGQKLYHLDLEESVRLAPSTDELDREFPAGPVAHTAEDLATIASGQVPSGTGRAYANRDPEVITRALQLLYAAAEEVES